MKRDLADAWSFLWQLSLWSCSGFGLFNALAPPQDLPWKPLDLDLPVGRATAAKLSRLEVPPGADVRDVSAATETCLQLLRAAGVEVERAVDRDDGGFCVVQGAVRIGGGSATALSPGGLILQCPLAVRYVLWDRHVLQPAAASTFGSRVSQVDTYGTYACRRIYGSADETRRPSEHARANAIDIAGFRLADGRRITVLRDWNADVAGDESADFLSRVRDGACQVFGTVLSPDYNAAHRDHLHLDGGRSGLCS